MKQVTARVAVTAKDTKVTVDSEANASPCPRAQASKALIAKIAVRMQARMVAIDFSSLWRVLFARAGGL